MSAGLLDRETELAAVEALVGGATGGGRVLAIVGPPGIGKTALIADAKALGQEAGMQVLSARGSELERPFSYGVVRQLFEPVVATAPPEEREELFAGAAALAAPLFDVAQRVDDELVNDASLSTLHGLYWLTANLAGRQPVLLTVDDLHWCDLPSLRWLVYLLPRMEGLDLAVVVGLREGATGEDRGLIGDIVADPLTTTVRPGPLSMEAGARLVREALSPDADQAFCAAVYAETGGNPLLLRELVQAIAAEGLAPTASNAGRLGALAARAGSRAVALHLAHLPAEAMRLAQAVAVLGDEADPHQAAALAGLSEEAAFAAAAALARVDVLRAHPPWGFVHPLMRTAVYETLTPLEQATAHARAARLLRDAGADAERVAAHLLSSSPAADAEAVASLRDAARRARSRGASESAVAYLGRALAEPPPAAERADLLLELGAVETHVSGEAAIEHLREAHALVGDPIRRAEIALLLGRQLFLLGGVGADAVFTGALEELDDGDAELGRMLEAGLLTKDLFVPSLHDGAVERLDRLRGRAGTATTYGQKVLLALLAYHDARAGARAAEVVPLARRALADGTLIREDASGTAFVPPAAVLAMADLDEAQTAYDGALAEAHRRGSAFGYAAVLAFRAQTRVWRGELGEAEAEAREALAAGASWGGSARFSGHATAFLADALMEQGRLDEAAGLLQGEEGKPLPDSARLLFLRDSNARLRILRGDPEGGLAETLDAGRRYDAVGSRNPAFSAWRSQAALVLHGLGRTDEARRLAGEEVALARTSGAPRALGAALRVAGAVEGAGDGVALLEEAVTVLNASPAKLEQAKARTELGAALHRGNRRAEAREQLRRGLELATLCGAAPVVERAESELFATGARPRRVALSGVASLTPSERRVADLAAEGLTNREIAQALFVTQRTVEVHLTSIYRKLDIGSRSQLGAALAEPA